MSTIPDGQDGPAKPRSVLFCYGGGGLPGLQALAGIRAALAERGVEATRCCGNSAGAIAAAFDAAGHTPGYFWSVLEHLRTKDVIPGWRSAWPLKSLVRPNLVNTDAIGRLLNQHLPTTFNDLKKPLTVFFTRERDGFGDWCNGEADDEFQSLKAAVLSSMSISGVFPAVVSRTGETFTDGGTWNNYAIPDDWQQHDEVWILVANSRTDSNDTRRALGRLLSNLFLMGRGQLTRALMDVEAFEPGATDSQRDQAIAKLIADGFLWRDKVWAGTGRVTKIRVLWPAFEDDGMLNFRPKLAEVVREQTSDALILMQGEIIGRLNHEH